jgi:hypothetical protein
MAEDSLHFLMYPKNGVLVSLARKELAIIHMKTIQLTFS